MRVSTEDSTKIFKPVSYGGKSINLLDLESYIITKDYLEQRLLSTHHEYLRGNLRL